MEKGTGELFQNNAKSKFNNVTRQCYAHMVSRTQKKKFPQLTFSRDEFRAYTLHAFEGNYDGVIRCRYCSYFFTIGEIAVDHAIPLSRGGTTGLDNLDFICRPCNSRKGSLTPGEYLALLKFLETVIPLGRQDVLNRLEISVQLVTSARANAGVIGDLRKSGQWQAALKVRREARKR